MFLSDYFLGGRKSGWHLLCYCLNHLNYCLFYHRISGRKLMNRVLDEVTTHLDAYSIRALARALRSWAGAILLITHDR
jgi:hypothetical protein